MQLPQRNAMLAIETTMPHRLGGKAPVSKLIIFCLLAIAVFFFIRSIMSPDDRVAQEGAGSQPRAVLDSGDTSQLERSTGSQGMAPAVADLPAEEANAMNAGLGRTQPAAVMVGPEAKPNRVSVGTTEVTASAKRADETTEFIPGLTGADGKSGSNGRMVVPESQIDIIKRVFAPELLTPADAGSG